jgi:hypothetical protein
MQSNFIPPHDHEQGLAESPRPAGEPDPKVWQLHWRRQLFRLTGLPLIAVGAGPERKAPANLRSGELLTGWQRIAHDHNQIEAAHKRVCSAGLHTGKWSDSEKSVVTFDIDGASVLEHCLAHACDPQRTRTWQTHRNTDPCRLKVKFSLTPEQSLELGQFKSKHQTKDPIKDEAGNVLAKGEALEIFHQPNSQVIVLGEHPSSKGFYFWPEGMGPEDLAPITPEWWALLLSIVQSKGQQPASKASSSTSRSSTGEWANCNPCPICGRNTTNWCSKNRSSEAINCRHGSTFSPELSHGVLRIGQTITGSDGTTYGFCGTDTQSDGTEFSKFVIHNPSKKRNDSPSPDPLDGFKVIGEGKGQQQAQQTRFTPRADSKVNWGHRRMSHTKAMACFDRCVEVQASKERNSLRRRARLLKAVADLELSKYVNRQEISQRVLEAKDRAAGRCFNALTADDRAAMERPTVEWLLPGLLPAGDLSIMGGRPKVGKTRLALALAGALLNGTKVFGQPAPTPTDVVLVSDDQADGDTADMLDALHIWNHPRLSWSRNFRLTEPDVDALLVAIRQRPGALVILDSLRSISRSLQYGENDPELGAILYDLKQAVIEAGGSLLIVHHCNKTADLVGVEALSGHSAIAGAANAILTMHYLRDDKGRPQKELPQRRLVREARSGQGLDIVLSPLAGSGNFYAVGSFSEWCKSQKEANEEQDRIGKMSPERKQILSLLAQDREAWLTRRQICEAIGVGWGDRGRGKDPQRVGHGLAWLVTHGFAESVRAGLEATFKLASQGTQLDESIMTVMPSSDGKASDPVGKNHDSHDKTPTHPPLVMTVMTQPNPSDSSSRLDGITVMADSRAGHPRPPTTNPEVETHLGETALLEIFWKGQPVAVLDPQTKQWGEGFTVLADTHEATVKVQTPTGRTANRWRNELRAA